jgi:hypothetical protein
LLVELVEAQATVTGAAEQPATQEQAVPEPQVLLVQAEQALHYQVATAELVPQQVISQVAAAAQHALVPPWLVQPVPYA